MTDCNNCKHENECYYNKRYDYTHDGIIDYRTDKKCNSYKDICDLLNKQEERINDLKETIIKITHSYHQKHDNTIINLVDEVYEEDIGDLFIELNGDVK